MPYRFGFVIEQSMGHITHTKNLMQSLSDDSTVEPSWMLVPLDADDIWQKIPNISLRLSLRSRGLVHKAIQDNKLDCLLYHTQLITLFSLSLIQRIPSVISIDATPLNFNTIGVAYEAKVPTGGLARLKFEWYRSIFHKATALVGWSNWVKQSLVQDYGVQADKVKVIPPGVNIERWTPTLKEAGKSGPLRLLFVGADFERKGGHDLLNAFRQGLADCCELDIVTKDETIHSEGSVRVHRGVGPNSPLLQQLFAEADIFVFPTLGDASPIAVLEAMASGLPIVTTNVGAIPEEVEDGMTGLLVPTNDPAAIVEAIRSLANDPTRRIAMGSAGRAKAERLFNAEQNYKALVDVLKECTQENRSCR
jgi:glycosyltransferase involved in cell wall biosynthesis